METITYINTLGKQRTVPASHLDILENNHMVQASNGIYVPKCDLPFYEKGEWPKAYDNHKDSTIEQLSDHIDQMIGQGSSNNCRHIQYLSKSIQAKKVESMDDIIIQDKQVNGGLGLLEDKRIIWD